MRGSSRQRRQHREIDRMLPWYANGTLERADREAVEQHLADCAQCREEVRRCRNLARTMHEVGDVAPEPHPVQLARLMRQIDESDGAPRRAPALLLRLKLKLQELFTATPRGWRWALTVQSALVVLLAVALLRSGSIGQVPGEAQTTPPAAYRTLSDPESSPGLATPLNAERALLRVVFEPDLPEQAMRETLLELRAEIVGGPSTFGVYTLAVPTQGAGSTPVEELLAHLRDQPGVQFAQPVRPVDGGAR